MSARLLSSPSTGVRGSGHAARTDMVRLRNGCHAMTKVGRKKKKQDDKKTAVGTRCPGHPLRVRRPGSCTEPTTWGRKSAATARRSDFRAERARGKINPRVLARRQISRFHAAGAEVRRKRKRARAVRNCKRGNLALVRALFAGPTSAKKQCL